MARSKTSSEAAARIESGKDPLAQAVTQTEGLHAVAVLQALAARLGLPVLVIPWGDGFRIVNHTAQREVFLFASGELREVRFDPKGAPAADPTSTPCG